MSLHNNPSEARAYTRRAFTFGSLALASASVVAPSFLQRSAVALEAAMGGRGSTPGVPEDRVLVVLQLSGGNDGLNTVIPFGEAGYYNARPRIAVPEREVLRFGRGADGLGLHPRLADVKAMYDEGLVGVVQGVGYPNPNRSHFKSMDIWHTADTNGTGTGWLGRYVDNECAGSPEEDAGRVPSVAIGRTAPLAMQGREVQPVAFENAALFRWLGEDLHDALAEPHQRLNERPPAPAPAPHDRHGHHHPETTAEFLVRTALDARVSSDLIRRAVSQRPLVEYPRTRLAQQMSMIASMIRAGLKTRVYYVSLGGFDTHAQQGGAQGRHGQLLAEFGGAVRAFYNDLKAQGNDSRVLTVSFSEFGRRVGQNASNGTDHGTAAPMFLFGPMARAGVIGEHPSLRDLEDGDLKHLIDFRSVYAGVLERWMRTDSREVLGRSFRVLPVTRRG